MWKKVPKYAKAQDRICGVHDIPDAMIIPTIPVSSDYVKVLSILHNKLLIH
jgi:hypothetical protein